MGTLMVCAFLDELTVDYSYRQHHGEMFLKAGATGECYIWWKTGAYTEIVIRGCPGVEVEVNLGRKLL